jgi:hypothetical protein
MNARTFLARARAEQADHGAHPVAVLRILRRAVHFSECEADARDARIEAWLLFVRERREERIGAGTRLVQVGALPGGVVQFQQEEDDAR